MTPRFIKSLVLLPLLILVAVFGCTTLSLVSNQEGELERIFHVRYVTSMKNCPVGESFRLWIPVPHNDLHQNIINMKVMGAVHGTLEKELKYYNTMYYFEGVCSQPQLDFTIEYDVERHEYSVDQKMYRQQESTAAPRTELNTYLQPSALCFVTPRVKFEAAKLASQYSSTIDKARAFYDHIITQMSYDKNHHGWGRGDITHACDVGKGNCTDFHTYFTALCLSAGIPSRFQIGMWGNYEVVDGEYKTGRYHCWAEFHVAGQGWVPVDISEADKDPTNVDQYFGSHTGNRVTLSTGRDIVLSPTQDGAPLNYFVEPYAEIGNMKFENVSKNCYWADIMLD